MAYTLTERETYPFGWNYRFVDRANDLKFNNKASVQYPSTRSGSKVDNWREKIRDRSDATSEYSRDSYRLELRSGQATLLSTSRFPDPGQPPGIRNLYFDGIYSAPYSSISHLEVPGSSALEAACLSKIYQQLANLDREAAVASTVAEGLALVRMFGNPFRSLVYLSNSYLDTLKTGRRNWLKRTERWRRRNPFDKVLAQTYLEYAFGVAPLISETERIAVALARWNLEHKDGIKHDPPRISATREAEASTFSFVNQAIIPLYGSWFYAQRSLRDTTKVGLRYVVGTTRQSTSDAGSLSRLTQLLGLYPRDFVAALWEVLPWSWLSDYFVNIGDILEAGVTSTHRVAWISKTRRTTTSREYQLDVDRLATLAEASLNGYYGQASGSFGGWTIFRTTLSRTKPTSLGYPPVTFTFPVKARQLTNMAAVLLQRRSQPLA